MDNRTALEAYRRRIRGRYGLPLEEQRDPRNPVSQTVQHPVVVGSLATTEQRVTALTVSPVAPTVAGLPSAPSDTIAVDGNGHRNVRQPSRISDLELSDGTTNRNTAETGWRLTRRRKGMIPRLENNVTTSGSQSFSQSSNVTSNSNIITRPFQTPLARPSPSEVLFPTEFTSGHSQQQPFDGLSVTARNPLEFPASTQSSRVAEAVSISSQFQLPPVHRDSATAQSSPSLFAPPRFNRDERVTRLLNEIDRNNRPVPDRTNFAIGGQFRAPTLSDGPMEYSNSLFFERRAIGFRHAAPLDAAELSRGIENINQNDRSASDRTNTVTNSQVEAQVRSAIPMEYPNLMSLSGRIARSARSIEYPTSMSFSDRMNALAADAAATSLDVERSVQRLDTIIRDHQFVSGRTNIAPGSQFGAQARGAGPMQYPNSMNVVAAASAATRIGAGEIKPAFGQESSAAVVECTGCNDKVALEDIVKAGCEHSYCRDCAPRMFQSSLDDINMFPQTCCQQELDVTAFAKFLSPTLLQRYNDRRVELQSMGKRYCSNKACSLPLPDSHGIGTHATCSTCETITCLLCGANYHSGENCKVHDDSQEILALAEKLKWRQCPGCKAVVEKQSGCNHITCRCKAEFCYLCGRKWRTCSCPMVERHNRPMPMQQVNFRMYIERGLNEMMEIAHRENRHFEIYEGAARGGRSVELCAAHPFAERSLSVGNELQTILDRVEGFNNLDGNSSRARIEGVLNQVFAFQEHREQRYRRLVRDLGPYFAR